MCNQSELKVEYVVGHLKILQTFKYDSAQCTITPAEYDSPAKRKVFQRFVGNILIICQGLGKYYIIFQFCPTLKYDETIDGQESPRQTWS